METFYNTYSLLTASYRLLLLNPSFRFFFTFSVCCVVFCYFIHAKSVKNVQITQADD